MHRHCVYVPFYCLRKEKGFENYNFLQNIICECIYACEDFKVVSYPVFPQDMGSITVEGLSKVYDSFSFPSKLHENLRSATLKSCFYVPSTSPFLWVAPFIFLTLGVNRIDNRYKKRWLLRYVLTGLKFPTVLEMFSLTKPGFPPIPEALEKGSDLPIRELSKTSEKSGRNYAKVKCKK